MISVQDIERAVDTLIEKAHAANLRTLYGKADATGDIVIAPDSLDEAIRHATDWKCIGLILDKRTVTPQHFAAELAKANQLTHDECGEMIANLPTTAFESPNRCHILCVGAGLRLRFSLEHEDLSKVRAEVQQKAAKAAAVAAKAVADLKRSPDKAKAAALALYGRCSMNFVRQGGDAAEVADRALRQYMREAGLPLVALETPGSDSRAYGSLLQIRQALMMAAHDDVQAAEAARQEAEEYPRALGLCKKARSSGELSTVNLNTVRSLLSRHKIRLTEHLLYKLKDELA
jgi:hypothetical protein